MNQTSLDEIDVLLQQLASTAQQYPHMARNWVGATLETSGGIGKGGNIDINAATLSLIDGAVLLTIIRGASATAPAGQGDAGNVNVNVTSAVDIALTFHGMWKRKSGSR